MVKEKIKQILVLFFLLILVLPVFASYYTDSDKELLFFNVNKYDEDIQNYAQINQINPFLLKAVLAERSNGLNTVEFNNNSIGLGMLNPFADNYKVYDLCLASKCMSVKIDKSDTIEKNKRLLLSDYADPKKNICCTAFLLKHYYSNNKYNYKTSSCDIARPDVVYDHWNRALRFFAGTECPASKKNAYFVERVNELYSFFSIQTSSINGIGSLSFTPFFNLIIKHFIHKEYDDIKSTLIPKLKSCYHDNYKSCMNSVISNFENTNNVEINQFCENKQLNLFNSIFDGFSSGLNFNKTCLYKITPNKNSDFEAGFTINFIKNNNLFLMTSDVAPRPYTLNFNAYDFNKIEVLTSNTDFKYSVFSNHQYHDVDSIFYLHNNSKINIIYGINNQFYDHLFNPINLSNIEYCNPTEKGYKTRFFYCLKTNSTELFFNWSSFKWVYKPITIKFAVDISR